MIFVKIIKLVIIPSKGFRIHKKDISTKENKFGVAHHFTNECQDPQNPHVILKMQLIKQVSVKEESKLDDTIWHRKKYWQPLLFISSHGMNSRASLYGKNMKAMERSDLHDMCCFEVIYMICVKSYIIS